MSTDLELNISDEDLIQGLGTLSPDDLVREIVDLDQEDLLDLDVSGPSKSMATVVHMRAYHHLAALKLACGEKASTVAAALKLTPQTMTRLVQSPQFADLISEYRDKIVDKHLQQVEMMELVNGEAVSAIHEKLIGDERETIPLEALRRLVETFSDRTGHSPIRRSQSVNFSQTQTLSETTLNEIREIHSENVRYIPPSNVKTKEIEVLSESTQSPEPIRSIAEILKSSPSEEVKSSPS